MKTNDMKIGEVRGYNGINYKCVELKKDTPREKMCTGCFLSKLKGGHCTKAAGYGGVLGHCYDNARVDGKMVVFIAIPEKIDFKVGIRVLYRDAMLNDYLEGVIKCILNNQVILENINSGWYHKTELLTVSKSNILKEVI